MLQSFKKERKVFPWGLLWKFFCLNLLKKIHLKIQRFASRGYGKSQNEGENSREQKPSYMIRVDLGEAQTATESEVIANI